MGGLYEYIKMAVQNIRANKGRSFLTMLGIIIGIASVIAIVSIGEGTKNQMNSEIDGIGSGLIAIDVSSEAMTEDEWITPDDVQEIRKLDTVGGVSVSNNYDGETVTGKGNFSIMLTGEGPDAKMINNSDMKYGSYFGETEIEEGKNVCVISDTDARQLFGTDDVVGMSLDITCYDSSKSFRIMGVTTQKENGTFVSYTYEPGSTMKTFSFMAAIESGLYDEEETYMSGTIKVGEYTIKDWNKYGWGEMTFDKGFYASSNVAATLLSQRLGRDKLKDFYKKLGFGKKTGISLPNEQTGKIDFNYEIEVANASFGQGMSVTPIQMVQAFTSVTNNGEVLKPYIVKKVVDPVTNKVILENNRTVIGKVASIATTEKVIDLLDGVVNLDSEGSSGYKYKTDKVRTIGKTGTAEIASENGGYLTGSINYVRSCLGAFPYDDPQIIVYMAVSKITDTTLPGKATRQLIDDVSTYLGIVKQNKNEYSNFKLTSYINQDVIKTTEELKSKNLDVVIIGDGSRIINQYPKSNSIVNAEKMMKELINAVTESY